MFQILISLFGIAVVYRNLSLLEKFEVITKKKMHLCFLFLQLPLFLFVIFKEQITFTFIFIGIFLLTLIFYRKIFTQFALMTYEKCHLRVIDHLILLMKSGKSAQSSLKIVFSNFSNWEKIVFSPLEFTFELQKNEIAAPIEVNSLYFEEIKKILRSNYQISDQLNSLREGLKIRHNLRHKSRQVAQQIRAQAIVAVALYFVFLFVSLHYFNLQKQKVVLFSSIMLFLVGFCMIFIVGGKIKWKT